MTELQCDELKSPIANVSCGSEEMNEVGYEGDTCSFTCDAGYELPGSRSIYCQDDGEWNDTETLCNEC